MVSKKTPTNQPTKTIYPAIRYEKKIGTALSREIFKRLTLLQFVNFVLSKGDEKF